MVYSQVNIRHICTLFFYFIFILRCGVMRPRPALNSPCSLLSETAGLAVPDPFSPGFPNTPDEFSVEQ